MEEDLLLVKNNEPRIFNNNKNKRVFQAETTMEMGSGSPDITTETTYSTTFYNTTLLTTLPGLILFCKIILFFNLIIF